MIMRSGTCRIFIDLGPNIFLRVQLGSRHGKVKHMQTFLFRHKFLNHLALVDRMAVNDQHQGSGYNPQKLFQKGDHLFTGQSMPVGLNTEPYPSALGRNQQRTQKIETLIVSDAGPLAGGLASSGPGAFERRDQREAAFIFQNEGRAQLATLFLSWVALPLSNVPPRPHPVARGSVGDVDCSSPSAASRARQHWGCSGPQTTPRSHVQSGRASSNLQRTRRHRRLGPEPFPAVSLASPIISSVDPVDPFSSSWDVSLPVPNDKPSLEPHSGALQFPRASSLEPVRPARAPGLPPTVHLFLFVSSPYYHTILNFHFSKINRWTYFVRSCAARSRIWNP